jgi:L-fucono-1,5-lactonase
MSVIDSHHHFWWLKKHAYKWADVADGRINRDFTPDDLRPELEACGIDGTVLVQVMHETGETAENLDIARDTDFVRGVVGWIPLADPPAAARALDELMPSGRLVGIRHLIGYEPDAQWVLQAGVQESLKRLAAHGLAFDAIPITQAQLDAVIETARRLPDLQVVINHLGRPPVPDQGWSRGRRRSWPRRRALTST